MSLSFPVLCLFSRQFVWFSLGISRLLTVLFTFATFPAHHYNLALVPLYLLACPAPTPPGTFLSRSMPLFHLPIWFLHTSPSISFLLPISLQKSCFNSLPRFSMPAWCPAPASLFSWPNPTLVARGGSWTLGTGCSPKAAFPRRGEPRRAPCAPCARCGGGGPVWPRT